MKTNNTEKEKFICQSTVIKDYGIPKSLLEKLIPNPKLVKNPHYKCAAPMKLYAPSAIKELLTRKDVQDAIEKRKQRSSAGKKAVQTKLNNVDAKADAAAKSLIVHAESDVETNAIAAYNEWESIKASTSDNYEPKLIKTTPSRAFLDRITVNYIRHNLTEYDERLCEEKGKVGRYHFYGRYKAGVLDAIAKAYPQYAAECERQK